MQVSPKVERAREIPAKLDPKLKFNIYWIM